MAKKISPSLKIALAFSFALFFQVTQKSFFPSAHIQFFASYLAICFCLKEHFRASWLAVLAGVTMDLLSTTKMGLWSLNFFMITIFLHSLKNYFYVEKPLHLAIYTTIISMTSSIFHYIFLFIFDRCGPFLGKWGYLDFLIMPVIDGFYAMVWFSSLFSMMELVKNKWQLKKK